MEGSKKITALVLILALFMLIMLSCSARKGVPYDEPLVLKEEALKTGEVLFNQYCNSCHPGGASGLGPAINNKPLPQFLIRFQVRNGIGTMPAFKEEVLTDKDVKNIAEYLVYLRKNG